MIAAMAPNVVHSAATVCLLLVLTSTILATPTSFVRRAVGPFTNESFCSWTRPRSAVIRDTLYIDGGDLTFAAVKTDGSPTYDSAPKQVIWYLNFTQPFNTSGNASQVLHSFAKPDGNLAPNYVAGAMLANDDELILYGGLVKDTDSENLPHGDEVLKYEAFQYGPQRASWVAGFQSGDLPSSLTDFITDGAAANAPSENLAFYFSGMRRPDGSEIRESGRAKYHLTDTAKSLVTVDLSTMRSEKWTNDSLPSNISGRAGAQMVWVPTGSQGVLVVIGGTTWPEYANASGWSDAQKLQNQNAGPGFMQQIPVYDVAGQKWYLQNTSGEVPPATVGACSVVASAKDGSSHQIYIYGGYRGLQSSDSYSDDVYILSIPSFIWIKAYSGTASHGRILHRCNKVYPDQMFVIGGQVDPDPTQCYSDGVIQIFNLNTLKWQPKYDPKIWTDYKVPSVVTAKIGGDVDGSATSTSPRTWNNKDLSDIFASNYSKTINNYYPYQSILPGTSSSLPKPTQVAASGGGGVPKWLAAVLGAVLGLIGLTAIALLILFYRRHRIIKRRAGSVSGTSGAQQNRIMAWLNGHPQSGKDVSGSTTETVTHVQSPSSEVPPTEAEGRELYEMADTSKLQELYSPNADHKTDEKGYLLPPPPPRNRFSGSEQMMDSPTVGMFSPNARTQHSPISPADQTLRPTGARTPVSPADGNTGEFRTISPVPSNSIRRDERSNSVFKEQME